MKIRVLKEVCISCGLCWALAPEIFELDPVTGRSRIREPYRVSDSESESVGEIPKELEEKAARAVRECPVGAIKVE